MQPRRSPEGGVYKSTNLVYSPRVDPVPEQIYSQGGCDYGFPSHVVGLFATAVDITAASAKRKHA